MTKRVCIWRRSLLGLPVLGFSLARGRAQRGGRDEQPDMPPNIPPLRRDLKGDRERNLKDLDQLSTLVHELRQLIGSTDPEIVSVPLVKKSAAMRKLAQNIDRRIHFDYA